MAKVDEALVDRLAQMELDALLEALDDPELRTNPQILARVRNFLKDNHLETTPETPGMAKLKRQVTEEIPVFKDIVGYDVDRRTN